MSAEELTAAERLSLLRDGEIDVLGRMPWSSNATFLVSVSADALECRAIYKPGKGERPLWDFPGGLFRREVAAFELSRMTELNCVPETVLRQDAPMGAGSLQRFVDADFSEHYFSLRERGTFEEALHLIAGFDLLANNADRKGGHLLVDPRGVIWGIDHGLCFHVEDKLRTVMWDYAGEQLPTCVLRACELVRESESELLERLLEPDELHALKARANWYAKHPQYPGPSEGHRCYPWPLV